VNCAAYGCRNNSCDRKLQGISFHRFPKNPARRKEWAKALRRKNWTPTKFSVLCSQHFTSESIDRTSLTVVRIREDGVPSVFQKFPEQLENGGPENIINDSPVTTVEEPTRNEKLLLLVPCIVEVKVPGGIGTSSTVTKQDFSGPMPVHSVATVESPREIHLQPNLNEVPVSLDTMRQEITTKDLNKTAEKSTYAVVNEHDYSGSMPVQQAAPVKTPTEIKLQGKLDRCHASFTSARRKLKTARVKLSRYMDRNAKLKVQLKELTKQNQLYEDELELRRNTPSINELFGCENAKDSTTHRYKPEIREFALTLYRHSPNAYKYVRSKFGEVLPHHRTLGRWRRSTDGMPDSIVQPDNLPPIEIDYSFLSF